MSIAGAVIGAVHRGPGISLNAGAVFAGYTIVRLLGSRRMGVVYFGQHLPLARREALHVLGNDVSADDDCRRRFMGQANLAAALWHPNVARVNDRGELNGQLWMSMDVVDGADAATLLRARYPVGIPADRVATVIAAIASTLDYAHQHHNLLHRNVNLANVLLTKPGDGDEGILLGDFGIARNTGDANGLTAANVTIGPFSNAASEQLTDEPIDGRAVQYGLEATAYPLPTGSTLFPQPTRRSLSASTSPLHRRHRRTTPPAHQDRPAHPQLRRSLNRRPGTRHARNRPAAIGTTPTWAADPPPVPPTRVSVHAALARQRPHVWHGALSKARQVTGPSRTGTLPCLPASSGSSASPPTPAPWLRPPWC